MHVLFFNKRMCWFEIIIICLSHQHLHAPQLKHRKGPSLLEANERIKTFALEQILPLRSKHGRNLILLMRLLSVLE
jgi:hypothetical protein